MSLGEFELIKKYFTDIGPVQRAALGVGDDCALLDVPAGRQLALSVDTLIADVHFPAAADPALIAQKALRSNLSDLAAAGAEPLAFTLALSLPTADPDWLAAFAQGLRSCADEFAIALIGGDTTRARQTVITVQVFGLVPQGQALLRSGAAAGDGIYVSGTLGAARAALDVLDVPALQLSADQRFWLKRYFMPRPRMTLGVALRGIASAAIDISDGFAADLGHILDSSGVGALVDAAQLPLPDALGAHADALDFALFGGDDYELCFTVPPAREEIVARFAAQLQVPLARVGTITTDKTLRLRRADGSESPLTHGGYRHF